ncbi:hypothetical protein WMY93_019417 [Mugilogobius chulae]|uniref:Uncharacterized protein n=1 Tax=Mugilogobius chulae TaxID=88201 RepID=A0AAW0NRC1_9GOBI
MLATEQQNSRKIMEDRLKHQEEMFAKERSQFENNLSQLKDQIEKNREAIELERQDWISKEKKWKEIEKPEKCVLGGTSSKKQQDETRITKPKMEVQKAQVPQSTMYGQLSDSESSSDESTSRTESIPRLSENAILSLSSQDTLHGLNDDVFSSQDTSSRASSKIGHPSQIKLYLKHSSHKSSSKSEKMMSEEDEEWDDISLVEKREQFKIAVMKARDQSNLKFERKEWFLLMKTS